jgi:hypothetical protein
VSADLVTAVYRHSRATGRARAVLLAMAHLVSHERLSRYGEALAWPSYSTLAEMCLCSRKTAERATHQLVELGEIRWTGETKGQGARVYKIVLTDDTVVAAIDASGDTLDVGSSKNEDTHVTVDVGSSPMGDADPPTHVISDRTDDISGRTHVTRDVGPTTPLSHDRGRMEKLERDIEQARAPRGARRPVAPPAGDADLIAYARNRLGPPRESAKERNQREAEERELQTEAAAERATIQP